MEQPSDKIDIKTIQYNLIKQKMEHDKVEQLTQIKLEKSIKNKDGIDESIFENKNLTEQIKTEILDKNKLEQIEHKNENIISEPTYENKIMIERLIHEKKMDELHIYIQKYKYVKNYALNFALEMELNDIVEFLLTI